MLHHHKQLYAGFEVVEEKEKKKKLKKSSENKLIGSALNRLRVYIVYQDLILIRQGK